MAEAESRIAACKARGGLGAWGGRLDDVWGCRVRVRARWLGSVVSGQWSVVTGQCQGVRVLGC